MKNYEIKHDEHADNPREMCDSPVEILTFHGRYSIGDKNPYKSTQFEGWDDFENNLKKAHGVVAILPVYMYDHGGIALSTESFDGRAHHARWDSGQIGFAFITRERMREHFGWKNATSGRVKKLEEWIRTDISEYSDYVSGDMYLVKITFEDGEEDIFTGFCGHESAELFIKDEHPDAVSVEGL